MTTNIKKELAKAHFNVKEGFLSSFFLLFFLFTSASHTLYLVLFVYNFLHPGDLSYYANNEYKHPQRLFRFLSDIPKLF